MGHRDHSQAARHESDRCVLTPHVAEAGFGFLRHVPDNTEGAIRLEDDRMDRFERPKTCRADGGAHFLFGYAFATKRILDEFAAIYQKARLAIDNPFDLMGTAREP